MSDVVEFYRTELLGGEDSALGSEDIVIANRLLALQRIHIVASEVGVSKVRKEVVPMLAEMARLYKDQHDVVYEVINAYLALADFVGDSCHLQHFFSPLFHISQSDDSVVRERALSVICEIINTKTDNPPSVVREHVWPRILTLFKGDWFTQTCSCAYLIAHLLPHFDNRTEEALTVFIKLCTDAAMVRRTCAQCLVAIAEIPGGSIFEKQVEVTPSDRKAAALPPCSLYAVMALYWQDTQETIRLSVLAAAIELAPKLNQKEFKAHLLPILMAAPLDRSWQVRRQFAQECQKLAHVKELKLRFLHLLGDPCNEVQNKLAESLAKLAGGRALSLPSYICQHEPELTLKQPTKVGVSEFVTTVLPVLEEELLRVNPTAKATMTRVFGGLASDLADHEEVLRTRIEPLLCKLVEDDAAEVRLCAIQSVTALLDPLGVRSTSHELVKLIFAQAHQDQWRIRLAVLAMVPALMRVVSPKDFEKNVLEAVFLPASSDRVYSIRRSVVDLVTPIVSHMGRDWAFSTFWPQLCEKAYHRSDQGFLPETPFYCRKNFLEMAGGFCTACDCSNVFLKPILDMLADPVPDVRLTAIRLLASMHTKTETSWQVKSAAEKALSSETELDCRFALKRLVAR
ncbi:MAG: uncharacterized protein KVP18_003041 [Porospora cf. gigantea A]|uniref:uncharacterized protein n=1 Tax=Porospora cf. gigantea A TaxID=2853593 RepID=UPI00355A8937|nr:MAG: hypothetical protein KVP18_003041 [Porospora cf. gigantea A]